MKKHIENLRKQSYEACWKAQIRLWKAESANNKFVAKECKNEISCRWQEIENFSKMLKEMGE